MLSDAAGWGWGPCEIYGARWSWEGAITRVCTWLRGGVCVLLGVGFGCGLPQLLSPSKRAVMFRLLSALLSLIMFVISRSRSSLSLICCFQKARFSTISWHIRATASGFPCCLRQGWVGLGCWAFVPEKIIGVKRNTCPQVGICLNRK